MISDQSIAWQKEILSGDNPSLTLVRPCAVGDGIKKISALQRQKFKKRFRSSLSNSHWTKFVPASGAATRMFQLTEDQKQEFCNSLNQIPFINKIHHGFVENKNQLPENLNSGNLDNLDFDSMLKIMELEEGIPLHEKPKALIDFHRYHEGPKSAFEEHLEEAGETFGGKNSSFKSHFTVNPLHLDLFTNTLNMINQNRTSGSDEWEIEFSVQDPSTNTIAVDSEGNLFCDSEGNCITRPGGHGALLKNLNEIDSDFIFIKNIDNISHRRVRDKSVKWMKILSGYLSDLVLKTNKHLEQLHTGQSSAVKSALSFIKKELPGIPPEALNENSSPEKLISLLNRPVRVCGMVPNSGEPGGGPFWVRDESGTESLQIVETSEIDQDSADQLEVLKKATHFNPVFMCVSLRDFEGNRFNLEKYIDRNRVITAWKTVNGKKVKILEHPGLWNGSMSQWNTVFIEVPEKVFTPVKSVLDLLRDEHQIS